MIILKDIKIENINNKSRLCANIEYNNKTDKLWYEVENKFEKYLCYERADCFLVAILLFAMEHKEDIKILGTPVTSKLFFNIKKYIIPAFAKLNGKYNSINIFCEVSNKVLDNFNYNGTGISRGVDSFCTLKELTIDCPDDLKVNCLTFFNVGSHKDFGGEEGRELFKKRRELSKKVALENGFEFIDVDSNISEFLRQIFVNTHTFRSMSAALAIQKMFKNYYYSSGYTIYEFNVNEKFPAKFETFILSMFSNDNISFYSSGCLYNRLEKTKIISDYNLAQKYLNVCFNDETNCGKCEKCIRTIFEFYANNSLENFKNVFNIDDFYKNIDWYELKFLYFYFEKKGDYIDTYNLMKKNNIKLKTKNIFKGYVLYILRHTVPLKIKNILNKRRYKNAK